MSGPDRHPTPVRARVPSTTRLIALVGVVVTIVIATLAAFALPAQAKSFGIDQVQTTAVVRPDGSMTVTEQVTYAFDGTFNHLTRRPKVALNDGAYAKA